MPALADSAGEPRMTTFPRAELDEMVQRWLDENRRCEEAGDWRPLAEMYD